MSVRPLVSPPSGQMLPQDIPQYFKDLKKTIDNLPHPDIEKIRAELLRAYHAQRTVFVFGNGGSAATASHMVCDLGKGTTMVPRQKRFRIVSLTDNVPTLTAWANDVGYEYIFAEQLTGIVQPNDVVFAISGSGNSPNILRGLEVARKERGVVLGLTGYEGGKMRPLCDVCAVVPSDNMQIIEDMHHSIAHALFTAIRCELSIKANVARA